MNGIFVTGTDTGIGKTHFTIACIHALQQEGIKIAAMKPVASGAELINGKLRNDDAKQIINALADKPAYEDVNPYCFAPPVSPHIAAAQAGVEIELDVIVKRFNKISSNKEFVIVEGVGGWLAPLSDQLSVADLASKIGMPVVMVVGIKLGCLNHAMITAKAIQQSGLALKGWVANVVEPDTLHIDNLLSYLTDHLRQPPLSVLKYQQSQLCESEIIKKLF